MTRRPQAIPGEDERRFRRLRRTFAFSRARLDTPLGTTEPRFLARWIGTLLVVAAAIGAITLVFPAAPDAEVPVSAVTAVLAATLGAVLLLGALDSARAWTFQIVLALTTALASLAVFASGSPISGAEVFYLWVSPYAFAFFSKRQASAQVAFIACAYAGVLGLEHHDHPHIATAGVLIGLWFLLVATAAVIGVIVRRISRALRDTDRRVRRAFVDSPIGAVLISTDLVVLNSNDAFCRMLRCDRGAFVSRSILDIVHPDDHAIVREVVTSLGDDTVEYEQRFVLPSGLVVWSSVAIALVTPEVGHPYLFAQALDITEHKRDQEALAYQAIHDPLTGLYNRTLFLERLAASLRRRNVAYEEIAVLMLDLDRFKVVNDSLGHQVGDQLLSKIAPRLLAATAPGDTLARFGGDEFVLLCDHLGSPGEAEARAARLLDAMRGPFELPTGNFTVSASVGVAHASTRSIGAHNLIRDADAALYRAKSEGRNRIRVFDDSMRSEALGRLALEDDLRNSINTDELVVEYQPVVDVRTGRAVLVEALVRWQHHSRGRLMPDAFISLAEETGFINELGDWVLSTSLAHLRHWQGLNDANPPLMLSVNVSGIQLTDQRFAQRVGELARRNAIAPSSIGIEVTESVLIEHEFARETLGSLRDLGCTILFDDFGTGYSSLSYLERFHVDIVKVDRTFIADIGESRRRLIVLEAILAMCRALGLRVIAEGVEEPDQLRQLGELGCTLIQGFVVAPPLPPDQVDALVTGVAIPIPLRVPGSTSAAS